MLPTLSSLSESGRSLIKKHHKTQHRIPSVYLNPVFIRDPAFNQENTVHLYFWFTLLRKYKFALKGDGHLNTVSQKTVCFLTLSTSVPHYIQENCFVYELLVLPI